MRSFIILSVLILGLALGLMAAPNNIIPVDSADEAPTNQEVSIALSNDEFEADEAEDRGICLLGCPICCFLACASVSNKTAYTCVCTCLFGSQTRIPCSTFG